eukprot:IDg22121t1
MNTLYLSNSTIALRKRLAKGDVDALRAAGMRTLELWGQVLALTCEFCFRLSCWLVRIGPHPKGGRDRRDISDGTFHHIGTDVVALLCAFAK